MSKVDVFLQGEGIKDIVRLQLEPHKTAMDVKRAYASLRGVQLDGELAVFIEDQDEPLADAVTFDLLVGKHGVRMHAHRCRRVVTKVTYSGRTVEHTFGPGTTVGNVKRWAASEFGISKEDAAELILQIAGSHDQPDVDVHIGSLTSCPACSIVFDLVPNARIQGVV